MRFRTFDHDVDKSRFIVARCEGITRTLKIPKNSVPLFNMQGWRVVQNLPLHDWLGNEICYKRCSVCGRYMLTKRLDAEHMCRRCAIKAGYWFRPYRGYYGPEIFDSYKITLKLPFWWSKDRVESYAEMVGFQMEGQGVSRVDDRDCTGQWFCNEPQINRKGLVWKVVQSWSCDV